MDDVAVPQHHRSGAHRARRHPLLVALATVVAVAVASAVLLWGLLTFDVLGVGDDLLDAGTGQVAGEPSQQPSGEVPPSPQGPAEASPSGSAVVGPSSEPVDRSLPVAVLNSTTTAGLATGAAEALTSAGWTVETVGNFDGEQTPTTVLYPEDSQLATAQELADEVGARTVAGSTEVPVLTVVLGPDYTG